MAQTAGEETFDGIGGLRIFLRSWRPEGNPRAVIVICHGVNSHGGQYAWAAEQFAKGGFAAYALDLRGRGKSEGERFYVENVADYVSDVTGVVRIAKSRDPGVPVFLLGHSAGGVVSSVGVYAGLSSLALPTDGSFIHRSVVTKLCPAGSERLDKLLGLLAEGKVDPTPMLTHTRRLAEIVEAYDLFRSRADGVIKIAIT